MNSDALIKRASVADLCAAYQNAVSEIRECFARLREAQARLNMTFNLRDHGGIDITSNGEWHARTFDADGSINAMKRKAWSMLVERMELRRLLSNKRMEDLNKQLNDGVLPDLTEENVLTFASSFMATAPDLLREMVVEVFDYLRPREGTHRSKYKTNKMVEVGPRVILTGIVERAWGGGFHVHYQRSQMLRSLENVFSALDGQGQTGKRYNSLLEDAINASKSGDGETDYFRFRACKNGNLHVEMKRADLLARFNQVAGGANLRPARSA